MIGVILAGGYGTRLYPLTKDVAKPLLPISDRAVIDFIVERVTEINVERIIVTINERFEEQFRQWLAERGYAGVGFRVEPGYSDEEKPGAIAGLARILDEIRDDCIVVAGDNLFTSSLRELRRFFSEKNAPVVALYDVGSLEKVRELSMVEIDPDGRVKRFIEKPSNPTSSLIGVGIYLFPRRILGMIPQYLEEGNNPDSPGYFIQWLHKRETVYGYVIGGRWWDIGTMENYLEAKRFFEERR